MSFKPSKILTTATVLVAVAGLFAAASAQRSIRMPGGWPNEVVLGLADDAKNEASLLLPAAKGVRGYYHYTYVNTAYESIDARLADIKQFVKDGQRLGLSNGFILQFFKAETNVDKLIAAMNDPKLMQDYFKAIKKMGEVLWDAIAMNTVVVVEPGVWATLLQARFHFANRASERGKSYSEILQFPALVRNADLKLGPEFDYLDMYSNTVSDWARAVMVTIRRFMPSPLIALHANSWSVYARGCSAGSAVEDINEQIFKGGFDFQGEGNLVNWSESDVRLSAMANVRFFREIFGWDYQQGAPRFASSYWPDMIAVDKYSYDAGYVKAGYPGAPNGKTMPGSGKDLFFWNQTQMDQWLDWSRTISQGLQLPLLALRIPAGNGSLPDKRYQYKDTFADWLFSSANWKGKYKWSADNWDRFKAAGFIGLWVGRDGWPAYGTHYGPMEYDVFSKAPVKSNGDGGWLISSFAAKDRSQTNIKVEFDEGQFSRYNGFCQLKEEVEAPEEANPTAGMKL